MGSSWVRRAQPKVRPAVGRGQDATPRTMAGSTAGSGERCPTWGRRGLAQPTRRARHSPSRLRSGRGPSAPRPFGGWIRSNTRRLLPRRVPRRRERRRGSRPDLPEGRPDRRGRALGWRKHPRRWPLVAAGSSGQAPHPLWIGVRPVAGTGGTWRGVHHGRPARGKPRASEPRPPRSPPRAARTPARAHGTSRGASPPAPAGGRRRRPSRTAPRWGRGHRSRT